MELGALNTTALITAVVLSWCTLYGKHPGEKAWSGGTAGAKAVTQQAFHTAAAQAQTLSGRQGWLYGGASGSEEAGSRVAFPGQHSVTPPNPSPVCAPLYPKPSVSHPTQAACRTGQHWGMCSSHLGLMETPGNSSACTDR